MMVPTPLPENPLPRPNVTGGQKIADEVARKGRRVAAILLTHQNPDHVGGLGVLHEKFPDTPIYASESTDKWMRDDPLKFYSLAGRPIPTTRGR
jgi:glyoxylase-like metal-dependent hydrolase (beta-lactamase superfamily II)